MVVETFLPAERSPVFAFQAMPGREYTAKALNIFLFFAALFYLHTVTYAGLILACKQRVGGAISVKTLVQWSLGLLDLLHRPCGIVLVSQAMQTQPTPAQVAFMQYHARILKTIAIHAGVGWVWLRD